MAKKSKAAVAQTAEPAKALAAKPKAPAKVTTAKKLSAAAKPKTPPRGSRCIIKTDVQLPF